MRAGLANLPIVVTMIAGGGALTLTASHAVQEPEMA